MNLINIKLTEDQRNSIDKNSLITAVPLLPKLGVASSILAVVTNSFAINLIRAGARFIWAACEFLPIYHATTLQLPQFTKSTRGKHGENFSFPFHLIHQEFIQIFHQRNHLRGPYGKEIHRY